MDKYEFFINSNKDNIKKLICDLFKKVDNKSNAFMPLYRDGKNGYIDYDKKDKNGNPSTYFLFHRYHDDKNNVSSLGANTIYLDRENPIINFEAISLILNEFGLSRKDCTIVIDYLERSENLRIYNRLNDPYRRNEFGEIERNMNGDPIRTKYIYDERRCKSPVGDYKPLIGRVYDSLHGYRWKKYFWPEFKAIVNGKNLPKDSYIYDEKLNQKYNFARFNGHGQLQNYWYPLNEENADKDIPRMADMVIKFLDKYCDKHKVAIFIASLMLSGDMNVRQILSVKDKAIGLSERYIDFFCNMGGNCDAYDFNDFLALEKSSNSNLAKSNEVVNSVNNSRKYTYDDNDRKEYFSKEEDPEYMSSHLGIDYDDRDDDDDDFYKMYIKESLSNRIGYNRLINLIRESIERAMLK